MYFKKNLERLQTISDTICKRVRMVSTTSLNYSVEVHLAKNNVTTLKVVEQSRELFLHSKYDPIREAEKFIEHHAKTIEQYPHVLFYGVGMGYHIDIFKQRFPDKAWSIYEPDIEVFRQCLHARDMQGFFNRKFRFIHVEQTQSDCQSFLTALSNEIHEPIGLLTYPSYENIYKDKWTYFTEYFIEQLRNRRADTNVEFAFAKRWVINSLMNLSTTLQSPNILLDLKEHFQDKPIIIVAAGPSLQEEYNNLRHIKDKGLAYIFAVGSANKALIAEGIYPDAVCTYDPQNHNYQVYSSMIRQEIDTVPMIYGTSVGFETLTEYKGPKLHMVTSQDTVSQYYFKRKDGQTIDVVNDAPTIAIVTLQLAMKLGANPIVLVGQNLAFYNEFYYAKSVKVDGYGRDVAVKEKDLKERKQVLDVYGNLIETNYSFSQMREKMEYYIAQWESGNIINTTKGGAAIQGAQFIPLETVIEQILESHHINSENTCVDRDWYQRNGDTFYDMDFVGKQIKQMNQSIRIFRRTYEDILHVFEKIRKYQNREDRKGLKSAFVEFDKQFTKLTKTDVYKVFIERIIHVHKEQLAKQSQEIIHVDDFLERAKIFYQPFYHYITLTKETLEEMVPVIQYIDKQMETYIKRTQNSLSAYRFYPCNSSELVYEGEWQECNYLPVLSHRFNISENYSNKKDSMIRFRFFGRSLKVLGSTRSDRSDNIEVKIDNVICKTSAKNIKLDQNCSPDMYQVIFMEESLEGKTHEVEIRLLDDDILSLYGVVTDKDGRLLYEDEVVSVDELEIGKKIRCHYRASYNQVGEFSGFGEKTADFISQRSSDTPDGDFYFIMVGYDEQGNKKLIADRNVQHSISWDMLNNAGVVNGKKLNFDKHKLQISLPDGGNAYADREGKPSFVPTPYGCYPTNNDFDRYIFANQDNSLAISKLYNWYTEYAFSLCKNFPLYGEYPRANGKVINIDEFTNYCVARGMDNYDNVKTFIFPDKNQNFTYVGFRPALFIVT